MPCQLGLGNLTSLFSLLDSKRRGLFLLIQHCCKYSPCCERAFPFEVGSRHQDIAHFPNVYPV